MGEQDREIGHEAERHVTRRCPRMREHGIYLKGERVLPVPCEDCYSIESVWRRIPYEPNSKTPVRVSLNGGGGQ